MGLNPLGGMLDGIWDSPTVAQIAFHPRSVPAEHLGATSGPIRDGSFDAPDGTHIAYRLYVPPASVHVNAVVYYFHGNAEVCTDAAPSAPLFHRLGAALLSVDYRGYAWSTGTPSLTKLCKDADACFAASHSVLEAAGCNSVRRILWGRSIGATCAVHLAANHTDKVHGLIVESGLMSIKKLPLVEQMLPQVGQQLLGAHGAALASGLGGGILGMLAEPCGTLDKMSKIRCPTLVMHGDKDEIVPVQQGIDCHKQCGSRQKLLRRWESAGHNDIPILHTAEWVTEITGLVSRALDFGSPFPNGVLVEAHSLSAAHLNGLRGRVLGPQGERVRVDFSEPNGEKALKPANLTLVEEPGESPPPGADLFSAGALVEAHSLSAAHLNGLRGRVIAPQGERLRVKFPDPHGEKALKPANLKLLDEADDG